MNDGNIKFVMRNGHLEMMTPYNTLITWFKADGEVDRKATIKSYSQFYALYFTRRVPVVLAAFGREIVLRLQEASNSQQLSKRQIQ
jgi:hypothetical protein